MEYSEKKTTTTTSSGGGSATVDAAKVEASPTLVLSPTSSSSSPPPSPPLSQCEACKILRRRYIEKCVFAPYFPPAEPLKFTIAHRVFGASNILKLLQELPEAQRADAVNSMVYEANARLRDPIYGCAGVIYQLLKQISDLQAEVAKAQAEILNIQCQNANLFELICKEKELYIKKINLGVFLGCILGFVLCYVFVVYVFLFYVNH